jgi:FlaA1/EpsC-like NDP-sugar epimerase
MEVLIKILYTIFFLVLNYFLYMWCYNNTRLNYKYLYLFILSSIVLFFLNIFFENNWLNKLFLILLWFSSSIIIFKYLRKVVDLSNRSKILKEDPQVKDKYDRLKNLIFRDLLVILLIIYQLLLIWYPPILNNLLE